MIFFMQLDYYFMLKYMQNGIFYAIELLFYTEINAKKIVGPRIQIAVDVAIVDITRLLVRHRSTLGIGIRRHQTSAYRAQLKALDQWNKDL